VEFCRVCEQQQRRDLRNLRYFKIESLWNEGFKRREIAAKVGTTVGALSVLMVRMRDEGWDLPYRHQGPWKDRSGGTNKGGELCVS
jgi:transposase